jgi:hypothetical protein
MTLRLATVSLADFRPLCEIRLPVSIMVRPNLGLMDKLPGIDITRLIPLNLSASAGPDSVEDCVCHLSGGLGLVA